MRHVRKVLAAVILFAMLAAYIIGLGFILAENQPLFGENARRIDYYGGWLSPKSDDFNQLNLNLLHEIPASWQNKGSGKTRLLYLDYTVVHGHAYEPRDQQNAPSCVGQAAAAAVDILAASEINLLGHPERAPPGRVAASVIYGLSRQEIGGLGPMAGGGSHCLWACQALQQYGSVIHRNYGLIGYDLSYPSPSMCVRFGAKGVPSSLEDIAKLHPVFEFIKIDSYEELRDAVYSGCPVIIGSDVGFGNKSGLTRDRDGFLNPPRRRWYPSKWYHAMVVVGVADTGRKGGLILNSWGSTWISGPKRFGTEPEGSFWADASIIEKMVSQGDSYAIRRFKGWPNYRLW